MGVYPLLLHEFQTADAQAYRGRRLRPTEIQLLYTSHIKCHSTPGYLLKDLSSEGLYRLSTPCCCLQHMLSPSITALNLQKKTFQNRTCTHHWKLLSKGENLQKFLWHTQNFLSKENFPVCHDLKALCERCWIILVKLCPLNRFYAVNKSSVMQWPYSCAIFKQRTNVSSVRLYQQIRVTRNKEFTYQKSTNVTLIKNWHFVMTES